MDCQDQRKTQTPGHESHGVYLCHKCGWPFPNPHPSAKHRRAHKKICGTVEGYKVCLSEDQSRLNGSDGEHGSDDDHKSPAPKVLEVVKNESGDYGIGEKVHRSEDEVFSDAVADFPDGGLSQGVKERLQEETLDSGATVGRVDKEDPKLSGSSEHNDLNDVNKLTLEAGEETQVQHPEYSEGEKFEEGNTLELQGQLSGSTDVEPLSDSIADLRAEESTIFHSDDTIGSATESHPSKAEATPDILPEENKSFSGEEVTNITLASSTVESNLKNDDIKSESRAVEIVAPSDTVVGETCEVESKIEVGDAVYSDNHVAEGTVNEKEKDSMEFVSGLAQDDTPHGSNSDAITNASINDVQVESLHASDVKIFHEKEEADVDANNLHAHDDRTDVPHPQNENEDSKDREVVVLSESVKHEEDDLKDTVTEENSTLYNPSQLAEKSDVLSRDMDDVMDSSGSVNKELVNSEPTAEPRAEEMHAEEHPEVSPFESSEISDDMGASMNAIKSAMNESYMVPPSEEHEPADVENSKQVSSSENILMALSNENPIESFDAGTSEVTSVISIGNTSHHEKNITEINDVYEEDKDEEANLEKDLGTQTNDLQPSDLLQLGVKQSSGLSKSEDAGEVDKIEKLDITDVHYSKTASNQVASPVISEAVINESTKKSTDIECTKEGIKGDEINSSVEVHEERNRSVGASAYSQEASDAELLMKAADDLAEKYTSLFSVKAEPSDQNDFSVEDNQDGQSGREVSGTSAVPVQDQSDNLVKHSSSGIDASVDSSSRCDSLEANWGSVSVLSMQSDAAAVIDTETSPSTGLAASKETGETNLNNHKGASEKQPLAKSEMFEAPSFMTLVESGHAVSHKAPASEDQKGKNPQQPSSTTSQAGWFPSQTHATGESQGNKNEEIMAKVTNWSTSKEHMHTPLKSLLGEAIHSNNPNMVENSVNQKNGKVPENNGSGLTTVNSILGPESPSSAQAVMGDAAKEWNSPARYPADMKREKRKSKSRPYWIQLVCCSTVDLQRR